MVNRTGVNRNTGRQPHWNGKNPAQIPDAAPRSRTALDPVAYDNLIKQHGVRVKVYRSLYCPNVKSVDGGEHNIDCVLCNGSGYLDVDPIESVAYLANQNFQEEMTVEGYHDGNSVGGTFLGGVELQYFTRVDLMDFTQPFYERVLRRADSTKGNAPTPAEPAVPGTPASLTIQYNNAPFAGDGIDLNNAFVTNSFFEITDNGGFTGLEGTVLGLDVTGITNFNGNDNIRFIGALGSPEDLDAGVADIASRIEAISTTTGTQIETSGVFIRRRCTVSSSGSTITLTQITPGAYTPVISQFPSNEASVTITPSEDGIPAVPAIPATSGTNPDDNLKYDCGRVNVIIDKTGKQYYQDIQFRLTPQGNIRWVGADQPDAGIIYSVHYESVIQYRAISAMHINRFAQVPDRSTGLVAQVKMPEQWMLQKEFLIIRRDEYGNEIQKTGIFGDIIANQPLNPSPTDSL